MHWHVVWKIKQIERQGTFTRLFIFCLPPRSTRYNNGNEQGRAFEKDLCLWQVKGHGEARETMYSDLTKPQTWHEWEGLQTHSSVLECKKEMLQGSFHKHYVAKLQLGFVSSGCYLPALFPRVPCAFFKESPQLGDFLLNKGIIQHLPLSLCKPTFCWHMTWHSSSTLVLSTQANKRGLNISKCCTGSKHHWIATQTPLSAAYLCLPICVCESVPMTLQKKRINTLKSQTEKAKERKNVIPWVGK